MTNTENVNKLCRIYIDDNEKAIIMIWARNKWLLVVTKRCWGY